MSCYLGDLNTPVKQPLGADVVPAGADVVQQAAAGHELGDQLHRRGQADPQQAAHVGVVHAGHYIGLLGSDTHTHTNTHTHTDKQKTNTKLNNNVHNIKKKKKILSLLLHKNKNYT